MGFNAMQPGKVRKADLIIGAIALVIVIGLILWAVL